MFHGCTAPQAHKQQKQEIDASSSVDSTAEAPVVADTATDESVSTTVDILEWEGERFTVLPLSPTFRRFGYEMYPTRQLDTAPGTPDSVRQLPNHRYRYDCLSGSELACVSVSEVDSEYLVVWVADSTGDTVVARTHGGAVKGVAMSRNLEDARERWGGRQVFARKRQINTYDSASGKMGSIKVSIAAPLTVEEVRWGVLPLPPQPLWLVVSTTDTQQGFIPTYVSWTNVLNSVVRDTVPWAEFVIETNPKESHEWSEDIWAAVEEHRLMTGMTTTQVRFSVEDPSAVDTVHKDGVPHQRWSYPGQYLLFRADTLVETVPR
jgi:hypothetical protein